MTPEVASRRPKTPRAARAVRWLVRLTLLAAAALLALGGLPSLALRKALPAASPLLLLADTLAARRWYAGLFWGIPAGVVIASAVFRGRLFCRWVCPAGTLHTAAGLISAKRRLIAVRLNGAIFWTIVFGAAAGFPFLIGLDPLSSANRTTALFTAWRGIAGLVPGLLLPVFLLLSVVQPQVWCTHFCPLGYFFDAAHLKGKRVRLSTARRDILIGLAGGLGVGFLGRWLRIVPRAEAAEQPVLPPGARDVKHFAATCSRCYACVNVCPTCVLRAKFSIHRTIGQLFQVELDTHNAYCEEFCNRCTEVCPSGAIEPLTLKQKRFRKMGTAAVIKEACLAWTDKEFCMVCAEYCPYHAIRMDPSDGVPAPVVNPEICRGCGACQAKCPAIRAGRAIIVNGLPAQTTARDVRLDEL